MATTEQDTTPETPAAKATTRTYVVLELRDRNEGDWREIGSTEATTDQQAISAVADPDVSGTWVAVPARSFNPRIRKFETPAPKAVWS